MTICLAAICTDGKKEFIVFATDHMVTSPLGSFEHPMVKYKLINKNTVAMLAGNPLIFEDLTKLRTKNIPYDDVKKEIYENFKNKRRENIQREILDITGINTFQFLELLQKPIPNEFVSKMIENAINHRLNTGILLIGFDEEGKAQITEIDESNYADFRIINFHAIGSGNSQAINALLFQKHDKTEDLVTTIYNVYKAKRNAEVLQGVGKETELLILDSENGCFRIEEKDINILKSVYDIEFSSGMSNPVLKTIDIKSFNTCEKKEVEKNVS